MLTNKNNMSGYSEILIGSIEIISGTEAAYVKTKVNEESIQKVWRSV